MIEIPNKLPETRPFNRAQAMAGAGVITSAGIEARVICWNMISGDCTNIVTLLKRKGGIGDEEVVVFDYRGVNSGLKPYYGDLCMAPLIMVEGKAMFHEDIVYDITGEPMTLYFEDFHHEDRLPLKTTDAANLYLSPPPIEFEGKPLHMTDKIWTRSTSKDPWRLVYCSDQWCDKPGIKETHFAAIKRNEGRQMVLDCYTRKSPYSTLLEGEELKVGDLLWYTHPSSRGKSFKLDRTFLNLINDGIGKLEAFTRKPYVKVEVWQAKAKFNTGNSSMEMFVGTGYSSKEECDELAPNHLGSNYTYIKSEKVSEYWQ